MVMAMAMEEIGDGMDEQWWWISFRCVADGSGAWRLCMAMNGSLSGLAPFTKVIGFDLGSAAAHRMGGRYGGGGLPVPVPAKLPGASKTIHSSPKIH